MPPIIIAALALLVRVVVLAARVATPVLRAAPRIGMAIPRISLSVLSRVTSPAARWFANAMVRRNARNLSRELVDRAIREGTPVRQVFKQLADSGAVKDAAIIGAVQGASAAGVRMAITSSTLIGAYFYILDALNKKDAFIVGFMLRIVDWFQQMNIPIDGQQLRNLEADGLEQLARDLNMVAAERRGQDSSPSIEEISDPTQWPATRAARTERRQREISRQLAEQKQAIIQDFFAALTRLESDPAFDEALRTFTDADVLTKAAILRKEDPSYELAYQYILDFHSQYRMPGWATMKQSERDLSIARSLVGWYLCTQYYSNALEQRLDETGEVKLPQEGEGWDGRAKLRR